MSASAPPPAGRPNRLRPSRLTALLHQFRTEGDTPIRQALAIGLGLYIGATPFWGFHLLIVFFVGGALHLNRFKMYMASHISNPLIAPFLYGLEIQVGAWARTGEMHSFAKLTELHLKGVALDILVGSVIVGGALGLAAGIATYFSSGGRKTDQRVHRLIDAAAERYLNVGLTPWEFAHGKLRMDPIYLDVLKAGVLPHDGTIVDLGCGQGLMLSLLAAARDRADANEWPAGLARAADGRLARRPRAAPAHRATRAGTPRGRRAHRAGGSAIGGAAAVHCGPDFRRAAPDALRGAGEAAA